MMLRCGYVKSVESSHVNDEKMFLLQAEDRRHVFLVRVVIPGICISAAVLDVALADLAVAASVGRV